MATDDGEGPWTVTHSAKDKDVIKGIGILDPHFSAFDPPVYKVSYFDTLMETMNQLIKFTKDNDLDFVVWGGDIFNLKAPQRSPHWFMAKVLKLMKEFQAVATENIGIAGNHDQKAGSNETLTGQPLEVLIAAQAYKLLDTREVVFQGNGFSVRVAGGSYLNGRADHVRDKKKQGATHLLALGHFWFGTQTGEFFGEPIYGPDFLKESEVDVYEIGHHHEDQGVQNIDGKYYSSHGSITRTGSHENDLTRRPGVAFFKFTKPDVGNQGIEIKILRPKVPAPEDIFDLDKRKAIKEEKKEAEEFITSLSQNQVKASNPEDILAELNPEKQIKEKVDSFMKEAEGNLSDVLNKGKTVSKKPTRVHEDSKSDEVQTEVKKDMEKAGEEDTSEHILQVIEL